MTGSKNLISEEIHHKKIEKVLFPCQIGNHKFCLKLCYIELKNYQIVSELENEILQLICILLLKRAFPFIEKMPVKFCSLQVSTLVHLILRLISPAQGFQDLMIAILYFLVDPILTFNKYLDPCILVQAAITLRKNKNNANPNLNL